MVESSSVMLLDAASMYFRAFYGVPDSLKSPDGKPVNAIRGFADMIARLVTEYRPREIVAAWDNDWRPEFRVRAIPSYKAHRVDPDTGGEDVPEGLPHQVEVIRELLAAIGFARIGVDGYEADDIIGTLTARARAQNRPVDVVTGDRDLFQLVDDEAKVRVLYLGRGVKNLDPVNEARLQERHAVTSGKQYAQMAILRGDPSDGLAGVAGVGEKTALKLLEKFDGLENLITAVDDPASSLTLTQRTRFKEARDYLSAAPSVVNVVSDIPIKDAGTPLPLTVSDPQRVQQLGEQWGLGSSLERLIDAVTS